MFFIYGTDAPLYHYPIVTSVMIVINVLIQILVSITGYDVTPWILTFGDGFPEMLYTYLAGGVGVGVLSRDESHYEHLGHFTVEQKRQRLLDSGAHILVHNPYENVPELLDAIFAGYKASSESAAGVAE